MEEALRQANDKVNEINYGELNEEFGNVDVSGK
jgi:hypothetical protein